MRRWARALLGGALVPLAVHVVAAPAGAAPMCAATLGIDVQRALR